MDRQSRLHRTASASCALRRSRSSGRVEGRPRSWSWRQLGGRARSRARGEIAAGRDEPAGLAQNQRVARDARQCADLSAMDLRRGASGSARSVASGRTARATLATSKWWKEERHGVFLDYNQNAKDRTTCSAYSVRPLPDARVSAPLHWHEVKESVHIKTKRSFPIKRANYPNSGTGFIPACGPYLTFARHDS